MADQEGIGSRLGLVSDSGQITGRGRAAGAAATAALGVAGGLDKYQAAGAAASFLPPPANLAAQLGLTWLGGRSQDRENRRRRLAQIQSILRAQRTTALGNIATLAYGQSASPGVAIHREVNKPDTGMPLRRLTGAQASRMLGTMNGTGGNEYLLAFTPHVVMVQYAIAYGEIEGLRDILVNGESVSFAGTSADRKYAGLFTSEFTNPGEYSILGNHFCSSVPPNPQHSTVRGTGSGFRNTQSVGENLARATCFFNLQSGGRIIYEGEPSLQFLLRGRKVRTVTPANALSTTRTYTAHLLWCLLDFILDPIVGIGWPTDQVDYERCAIAAELNTLIEGTGANTAIGARLSPNENPLSVAPGPSYGDVWDNSGFRPGGTGDPLTDGAGDRQGAQTRAYHHECNMAFDDVADAGRVILQMAASCPWLVIERDGRGRLYFDLPDWRVSASTARIHTITDSELMQSPRIDEEQAERLVTRANVQFEGVNKDFAFQGATYPTVGGAAETALAAKYGGDHEQTFTVPGIMDKAHAFSFGGAMVAQSLRKLATIVRRADIAELDVGKVVRLQSVSGGEDDHYRLLTRQPKNRIVTEYTAIEYVPSDYAPRFDNKDAFVLEDPGQVGALTPPGALTATLENRVVELAWTKPDPLSTLARNYIIQRRARPTGDWETLAVVPVADGGADTLKYPDPAVAGTWQYQIATAGTVERSGFTQSGQVTITAAEAAGVAPPVIVAVLPSGDDPRIQYRAPTDRASVVSLQIDLEFERDSAWDVVSFLDLPISEAPPGMTRGRSFANVGNGRYRFRMTSIAEVGAINSSHVYSPAFDIMDVPDRIPGAPPAPTVTRDDAARTLTVAYTDPSDNGGSALVAFLVRLYKDSIVAGSHIAVERKGALQGREYVFEDITESGTYYADTAALNANNRGPGTMRNWSALSSGVAVGDATGITNKVRALAVGSTYTFRTLNEDAEFRVVRGDGHVSADGVYMAPASSAEDVEVGLYAGDELIDSVTFRVTQEILSVPVVFESWSTTNPGATASRFRVTQNLPAVHFGSETWLNETGGFIGNAAANALGSIDNPLRRIPGGFLESLDEAWLFSVDLLLGGGRELRMAVSPSSLRTDAGNAELSPAFETRGRIRIRATLDGTDHSVTMRAKGTQTTPADGSMEPYRWALTDAENTDATTFLAAFNATLNNVRSDSTTTVGRLAAVRARVRNVFVDFIPDIATATPAGTITNKIASLSEDETYQYEISEDFAGGIPTFLAESDGIFVSLDGIVTPKEVASDSAADSETVGLYSAGTRVDGDSFNVTAVAETGRIFNKIDQLFAHQEHAFIPAGVMGGSVTWEVSDGVWSMIGATFGMHFAEIGLLTHPQDVTVTMLVGGVVVDSDTFTFHPTIARIANKLTSINSGETHQFRAERLRASGLITWRTMGGSVDTDSIDAMGNYTPPPASPDDLTQRVEMLLDGTVVDFNLFRVPSSAKSLTVTVTQVEVVEAGATQRFVAAITGTNVSGDRTITWQTLFNADLFGGVTPVTGDATMADYAAPATVDGQGFPMAVQVIVDQDGVTGFATAHFWVSPTGAQLDDPTVEAFVTQDDIRIVVFNPELIPFGALEGFEIVLQRKAGDSFTDVETVTHTGLAPAHGIGRTFANQGPGTYRGKVTATGMNGANDSNEILTEEISVLRDFPDLIPGAPPAPTLTHEGNDLIVDYANPDDDGGTHLVRFHVEIYRGGTTLTSRVGNARVGTRQGRQKVFYNFAGRDGTYYARVAADNANSAESGEARNWSPMSEAVVVG